MIVLLCVDASIFASLAFAHIHLSMALDVCRLLTLIPKLDPRPILTMADMGMDHGDMAGMAGMDSGGSDVATGMPGMDHGNMPGMAQPVGQLRERHRMRLCRGFLPHSGRRVFPPFRLAGNKTGGAAL